MASSNPPIRGVAFTVQVSLRDMANPGSFKASPTLAAGDFKVSKDQAAFTNLATLPNVSPAGSISVLISLSAAEMTADTVMIQCIDQTSPKEWADQAFTILTTPG
jgi:hypothetical protein